MINDIKNRIKLEFLEDLTNKDLFVNINELWNYKKFKLYSEFLCKNMIWVWHFEYYDENFSDKFNLLLDINAIYKFQYEEPFIIENDYYWEYYDNFSKSPYYLNFDKLSIEYCWIYTLEWNIKKIFILKDILYNKENLNLKISRNLLNVIINLLYKYDSKEFNPFKVYIIKEELCIEDKNYIFNDIEIFIYAIAIYKWNKVRKLINYIKDYLTEEEKSILQIALEKDEKIDWKIFWFVKDNQDLYINHINGWKFHIKKVNFESDYEIVADEMYKSKDWIIELSYIKKEYDRAIASLSDTKKFLWFKDVLNKLFFNGSNKDKLIFNKTISQEILEKKNINEIEVLNYLKKVSLSNSK